jgi:hypothetical protein
MYATDVRSAAEMGSAANVHPTAAKMRRASRAHTATTKVCAAAADRMGSSAASTTTKTTTTDSSRRAIGSAHEQGHHGNNGEALVHHGTLGEPAGSDASSSIGYK